MLQVTKSSGRAVCATRGRKAACRPARAVPGNGDAPTPSGTVFYAGNSYTESEWSEALATGKLARSVAPTSNVQSAVASSLTFTDVMGFSGTAPELVNGRLAMLGFVSAIAAEFASGESVLKQWAEEPTGVAVAFLVFVAGSLVTAFQGKREEQLGPFTPQAEMLNGRAAMLGFAAMLVIEAVKGSPLL